MDFYEYLARAMDKTTPEGYPYKVMIQPRTHRSLELFKWFENNVKDEDWRRDRGAYCFRDEETAIFFKLTFG